jgi:hypothetical protein
MVLKMSAKRIATLTWVLIFGGILSLALGLVMSRSDAVLGWSIAGVAIVAVVVGVVLIWVRSRMEAPGPP